MPESPKMFTFVFVKSVFSMQILIAFDSFKGCLSSQKAGEVFARGVRSVGGQCRVMTMSDGGDGMLPAFLSAMGGERIVVSCHDAMMRRITASYGLCGQTAIVEVAEACGLARIEPENRNPLVATSYGVGELLADAVRRGARECIIGLGGTATSDCGVGMLRGLIDALGTGARHSFEAVKARYFSSLRVVLASDVESPLCGPQGAARVFAPQKGATEAMIPVLERRAKRFAAISARHFGYDFSQRPGAGAAGGLGYAFMEYFQATMCSGAELLLKTNHFDEALDETDLIVTGEGSSDAQTLMGKLPYVVLCHGKKAGVPVQLWSGRVQEKDRLLAAGYSQVGSINPDGLSKEEAMKPEVAEKNLFDKGAEVANNMK